ncbi:hypothetical protein Prudu_008684 [Prunus dulcis]|uniref:Uncharacterized protein n=1 Tax=Prunus dulcis TaxID=3755 RepID=A0A4Y1R4N3_PRUDU|nr:hypothetical protein Prudu_008684 [Prunus dulcis]
MRGRQELGVEPVGRDSRRRKFSDERDIRVVLGDQSLMCWVDFEGHGTSSKHSGLTHVFLHDHGIGFERGWTGLRARIRLRTPSYGIKSKKIINSIGFKFFQTTSPSSAQLYSCGTQTINLLPDSMEFFIEHFDRFTILTRKDGLPPKLKQDENSIGLPGGLPYIISSSTMF